MKKILLTLGIAWMAFSSCSKEEGNTKYVTTFYFKVKYGGREIVEYGNYFYNQDYNGPRGTLSVQNDSAILQVWPDYLKDYTYLGPITFSKNGTDIIGDYTVRNQQSAEFTINTAENGIINIEEFKTVLGSEKLTITKTGDSKDGKYAQGTMSFDTYTRFDSIPVSATASFSLKME
jgi:hypothetical protein